MVLQFKNSQGVGLNSWPPSQLEGIPYDDNYSKMCNLINLLGRSGPISLRVSKLSYIHKRFDRVIAGRRNSFKNNRFSRVGMSDQPL